METKHTKGIWVFDEFLNDKQFHVITGEKTIARIYTDTSKELWSTEAEANAKLIAEAPKTIELGIKTRDLLWKNFDQLPMELKPLLNEWREAIKKATD